MKGHSDFNLHTNLSRHITFHADSMNSWLVTSSTVGSRESIGAMLTHDQARELAFAMLDRVGWVGEEN